MEEQLAATASGSVPAAALSAKARKKQHRWTQKNRWMAHYQLKYGVVPVELAPALDGPPVVMKAKCRFCECFGRELSLASVEAATAPVHAGGEDDEEQVDALVMATSGSGGGAAGPPAKRRKKRQTLKVFGPNFRTDNLESHLSREHPARWREYERLGDADKKLFFPDPPPSAAALEQAAAAASFASTFGLALGSVTAGANGLLLLPPRTAGNGVVGGGDALGANAVKLAGMDKAVARLRVAVAPAIVELLDQLLANRTAKAGILDDDELKAPTALVAPFVRVDEALERSGESLTPLSASVHDDGVLELTMSEAELLFLAEAFSAGLDVTGAHAMVRAARSMQGLAASGDDTSVAVIATTVRHIAAVNLSALGALLAATWGFALVLRFSTQRGGGFVEVRALVPVNDEVHDVHVLALPLDERRHSVDSLSAVVAHALTAIDARAMHKLVGVTVDGDPAHMTPFLGVASNLRQRAAAAIATPGAAFYVLHSAPFLLSHVVEELLESCEAEFGLYATLLQVEALAVSTRAAGGVGAMAISPPPSRTPSNGRRRVHWIDVYELCHWCAIHREALARLCLDQELEEASARWSAPSNVWWALVFVFRDLLKDVLSVYDKCSRHATSFVDVQRHLRELVFQLKLKFNIKPASDLTEATDESAAPKSVESTASGSTGDAETPESADASGFSVDPSDFSYQDFVNAVIHLDMFMYEAFHSKAVENFSDADREAVYQRFNVLLLLLISKLQTVTAVSADSSSAAATATSSTSTGASASASATSEDASFADLRLFGADIPPSTPYELITMNNLMFMELLNSQQARVRAKWSGKVVALITEERNRMAAAFALRGAFYESITAVAKQQHQGAVAFREAWRDCALDFPSLCSFAAPFGALLAVSKEDSAARSRDRTCASNLALEAFFHGQQLRQLMAVRRQLDTIV